jgi:carboxylate-amine ligase
VPEPRRWWWELRLHPEHGTLEVRVPDAQTTVADAAAVTAVVQCLVAALIDGHAAGEPTPLVPTWRIAENRWSAARWGVHGELADVGTGERRPVAALLAELLEELAPVAARLGCAGELAEAHRLAARNGADRQREAAARGGVREVAAMLAATYVPR